MYEVFALAGKDLKLLLRDKAASFFTFVFPLLYSMLFGAIMSGMGDEPSGMKIVVVDEDRTAKSIEFVETLKNAPEFTVFIEDRQTAADLVRRGKRTAYVVITPGFGEARERMFWGDPPKLITGIDPSRKAEAGMLNGVLTKYLFEEMGQLFTNPDAMRGTLKDALTEIQAAEDMDPTWKATLQFFLPALDQFMADMPDPDSSDAEGSFSGFEPVSIESEPVTRKRAMPNSWSITFPQGVVWAVMGCTVGFAISLVIERARGTLVRLRTAPITPSKILAGKGLACFATTIALEIMILSLGILGFGVRPDSFVLLILACLCVSTAFVGIMMLLSVIGKTEQAAGGIGWAVMLVMAMIGGGMIPLMFLPQWLQTVSHISPVKWSILALEGAIWRGFSFTEMLTPCIVLIGVGLACFALGLRFFRWSVED